MDLIQGDITLPYIYGFADSAFKKEVKLLLSKETLTSDEIKRILVMLAETGALEKTRQKFNQYLKKAQETVKLIKGNDRRRGLYAVCNAFMTGTAQIR